MKGSTLVHVISGDNCIGLRTVNRTRKSPHWFYILRQKLEDLDGTREIIVNDINSFAILRRDCNAGTVRINFTWLDSSGHNAAGYQETVILPHDKLAAFLRDSATDGGPAEWKALSADDSGNKPKIIFNSRKNLHAALANGTVRRKLVRFLRDGFNWPGSEKIELFDDFTPYSFFFNEIRNGKTAVSGGLILHRQEGGLREAYYSIHT